jgi:hypothetical protein
MFKLRLLQFVAAVVLGFSLLADFAFGIGVCTAFVRGGLKGVAGWINHITYEGTWQTTEVSPGLMRVTMPNTHACASSSIGAYNRTRLCKFLFAQVLHAQNPG